MFFRKLYLLVNMMLSFFSFGRLQFSASIVSAYFKSQNIGAVTILSCWDTKFKEQTLKEFWKHKIMVSYSLDALPNCPAYRSGAVLDLMCDSNGSKQLIDYISKLKGFGLHTHWLVIDKTEKTDEFERTEGVVLLETAYVLPGSDVTLAQISTEFIQYFEVYRITVASPLRPFFLGSGTLDDFTTLPDKRERSNFENETLRAATVVRRPDLFNGLDDLSRPDLETWPKLHYPIIRNLGEMLNFTLMIQYESDYGFPDANGTVDGVVGLLLRGEVDFSETGMLMRMERVKDLDYTINTFPFRTAILFREPPLSTMKNIFLLPFSKRVWISLILLCVLVIGLLGIGIVTSKFLGISHYSSSNITISDLATLVIGNLFQQGTDLNPISSSTRMTILMMAISAIFFFTAYSANIVSLLQLSSSSIKKLSDISHGPLMLKLQNRSYINIFFKESSDPQELEIYREKVLPFYNEIFCEPEEGIELLRTDLVAFFVELNLGFQIMSDTYIEREKCGISELPLFFFPKMGVPLVKNSGYRELFTQKLMRQKEVGMINRLEIRYLAQKPQCESHGRYRPVGLIDMFPATMVILYGALLSFSIFILEVGYKYRRKVFNLKIPTATKHTNSPFIRVYHINRPK